MKLALLLALLFNATDEFLYRFRAGLGFMF